MALALPIFEFLSGSGSWLTDAFGSQNIKILAIVQAFLVPLHANTRMIILTSFLASLFRRFLPLARGSEFFSPFFLLARLAGSRQIFYARSSAGSGSVNF